MNVEPEAEAFVAFVHAHRLWAAPLVFVLAFAESLPFVSLLLPFFAVLVALSAVIGVTFNLESLAVWMAAGLGAGLGDWLAYAIGRRYHEDIVGLWPISRYPEVLKRGYAFFNRYGPWAIALGRFSGPLRASVPVIAGAARMRPLPFHLANWPSAFIWAGLLLLFGDLIAEVVSVLHGWLHR
jgi:membrane protein DedA with SNARE-associated domain